MSAETSPSAVAPFSVVVVSFGNRNHLTRCLESLHGDADDGLVEVWVVDNASSDGSPDVVAERFPWARLIALNQNVGYGKAVNAAAERSRSEWVVACNDDIEVMPGALSALLEAGRSHPRVGAVSPLLRLPDGGSQHSCYPFPTLRLTLAFNLGLQRLSERLADRLCLEGHWDPDRRRAVPWAIAAFLAVRREAFDQLGGFDPALWLFAEDLDLGWRLHRHDWVTLHVPEAVVAHEGSVATTRAFGFERTQRWLQATYVWMILRRGIARSYAVAGVNAIAAALRWAVLSALRPLAPRRVESARQASRAWAVLHWRGIRAARAQCARGAAKPVSRTV